ncbi:uncharacterized protein [Panulirus ornatus]|uniref:uncharacterized protein isoform X1 n=1 Tax=Panulirus ornatus TaxID=150431 RepID=UPI003A8410D2
MKTVLMLALAAVAAALPTPDAKPDADPGLYAYTYPNFLTYSYKTVGGKVPASTSPLVYSYPGVGFPYSFGYSYGYPFGYGFPYGYPWVVSPAASDAVAEA